MDPAHEDDFAVCIGGAQGAAIVRAFQIAE